jgi:hypothetical protein
VEELDLFPSLQDKMNYLSDVRVLAELPDWCWGDKMNYLSDVRVLAELPDWSCTTYMKDDPFWGSLSDAK